MKTWLISGALLVSSLRLWGQTAVPTVRVVDEMLDKSVAHRYYDQYWVPLAGPAQAHCYDQLVRLDSAGLNWRSRRYVLGTGRLILEQYFTGAVPGTVLEGPSREWYETGQLREEVTYHKSLIVGALRTYYPDGRPRRVQYVAPAKGTSICYDSTGKALSIKQCPPYHTFAQLRGKSTYSGNFLKAVQQRHASFLPAAYQQDAQLTVYYAFRIDASGAVRDARILTEAPAELQAAILAAIAQLPSFVPAVLEGKATNDVVEGFVRTKARR